VWFGRDPGESFRDAWRVPSFARDVCEIPEDHLFDRKSVVREHELSRHALEHLRGSELDVSALKEASATRDYIRDQDDPRKVTTRETMGRE
jgi:hypothetical protein